MKNALFFSLIAMVFYATEIVVTDLKLGKVSPKLLTILYSGGVMACAIAYFLFSYFTSEEETRLPTGNEWWYVVLMVAASFIAASAHFYALNQRATAVVMCTFYALLPVTASLLVFVFSKRELPSWKVILAWVLAAVAVYLVASEKE